MIDCLGPTALMEFLLTPERLDIQCASLLLLPVSTPNLHNYLKLFLITCAMEAPVYALVMRKYKFKPSKVLCVVVILNIATHPFVNFLLPVILKKITADPTFAMQLLAGEIFAPVIEGLLHWRLTKLTAIGAITTAAIANILSWSGYAYLASF